MNISIISNNLRKLRLEKHYTQEQAAEALSVSAQSVSRWECGTTLPEITLLPRIARLYAVTVDDLFREDCCAYQNYAQRLLAVYEASGKLEDFFAARSEYQRLFAGGHYDAEDLRSCGVLHQYLMEHARDEALSCFDRVLKLEEKDDVYYRTCRQKMLLLAQTGRCRESMALQESRLDREDPKSWLLLTAACFFAEAYDRAYTVVKEAMEKFPEEALLRVYGGDICQKRRNYEEAFGYWEKALELDPDCLDARYSMAACWEELGELKKAFDAWTALAEELSRRGLDVEKEYPLEQARKCRTKI